MKPVKLLELQSWSVVVGAQVSVIRFDNKTVHLLDIGGVYLPNEKTAGIWPFQAQLVRPPSLLELRLLSVVHGLKSQLLELARHPLLGTNALRARRALFHETGIEICETRFAALALQDALPCAFAPRWQIEQLARCPVGKVPSTLPRFAEILQGAQAQLATLATATEPTSRLPRLKHLARSLLERELLTMPHVPPALLAGIHEMLHSLCETYEFPFHLTRINFDPPTLRATA